MEKNKKITTISQLAVLMDEKFNKVDERFTKIDERFNKIDKRFDVLESDVKYMKKKLNKVESKLHTFIENYTEVDLETRVIHIEDMLGVPVKQSESEF